ncbi:hypothetical protein Ciccas_009594, partial [Cichlidogyrus casuarinus]
MAIGPLTITAERSSVVDFTESFMSDGLSILVGRPKEAENLFRILNPFNWSLWLLITGSIFVLSVCCWLCSVFSPFSSWEIPVQFNDEMSVIENIWASIGSILLQGTDFYPNAYSARAMMTAWWVFCVIVQAAYQADMTAFLTQVTLEPTIKDLSELLHSTYFQPLVQLGTTTHDLFAKAPEGSLFQQIYRKIGTDTPQIHTSSEATSLVASNRRYVFISQYGQLYYYAIRNCSEFKLTNDVFNTASFGFA